jgi:hypothetical protein
MNRKVSSRAFLNFGMKKYKQLKHKWNCDKEYVHAMLAMHI